MHCAVCMGTEQSRGQEVWQRPERWVMPTRVQRGEASHPDAALAALEREQLARALAISAAEASCGAPEMRGGAVVLEDASVNDAALARALQEEEDDAAAAPATPAAPRLPPGVCAACAAPLGWTSAVRTSDGQTFHAACFTCSVCSEPISDARFALTPEGRPCHAECHAAVHRPRCDVCDSVIASSDRDGLIRYHKTEFWQSKSCEEHAHDGTRRCACCTRYEKRCGPAFAPLPDDTASLCLECVTTAVLSEQDAVPLYHEVAHFLRASGAHLPYLPPLRLVPSGVLSAWASDAASAHESPSSQQVRGLTLVSTTSWSLFGLPSAVPSHVSVTGIAILSGLPILATGAVMAHELCHAHLRLHGRSTQDLSPRLEEGLCQLWSLLWLEHRIASLSGAQDAQLGAFLAHQIRTDPSPVYGDGVRDAMRAYQRHGLAAIMDHVKRHRALPT